MIIDVCWAIPSACAIQAQHNMRTGAHIEGVSLSSQVLVDTLTVNRGADKSTSTKAAYSYAKKSGLCKYSDYEFNPKSKGKK